MLQKFHSIQNYFQSSKGIYYKDQCLGNRLKLFMLYGTRDPKFITRINVGKIFVAISNIDFIAEF